MPAKEQINNVVHAYDIRGIFPDQLDAHITYLFGRAFARFVNETNWGVSKILAGRDMRLSGPDLYAAFTKGVLAEGLGVVDLGLISSDLLYFASGDMNLPGAIITASHNPSEYNGIKMCGPLASPIGEQTGLGRIRDFAIQELAEQQLDVEQSDAELNTEGDVEGDIESKASTKKAQLENLNLLDNYVRHTHSFIDSKALAPLKVVVDAANGMAGLIVPAVLEDLNVEVDLLFGDLDGSFPNHPPNPLEPSNLVTLISQVKNTGADVGLAFDGDADRVFLIDDMGMEISGSVTTALIAKYILERYPGEQIGYNLICSRAVPETIQELGGIGVKTQVGHSHIKQTMADSGAIFAGEHSGHYYFRDNFGADSGMIAALMVMEILTQAEVPLSELKKPFQKYISLGERNMKCPNSQELIEGLSKAYGDYPQERLDGLSVDLGSGWFNLRPSNTEPFLRINLEARSTGDLQKHWEELEKITKSLIA